MDTIIQILVIVLLTLLEAVFVAAEIALVTMRRTRIAQLIEEGNGAARRVHRLGPESGAVPPAVELGRALEAFPARGGIAEPLALVVVTLLLALFTIVFGELVPKS